LLSCPKTITKSFSQEKTFPGSRAASKCKEIENL
jgi:hypothetical protein